MGSSKDQLLAALSKKQIMGTIPSGFFIVDDKRNVVYWNKEAERITGYPSAEIVGQHCSILEGIECGRGCGLYDADTPEKPIIGAECHIRTREGSKIVISKNIDYLHLDGEMVGGIETFIDITSQKEMEGQLRVHSQQLEAAVERRTSALQEERAALLSILDGMTDLAYIVTADLRIDFFNKAMEKVFGSKKGARCYDVIHGREKPCDDCPWEKIITGNVVEERDFKQDNHTYEVIHSPVYGYRGEIQKLAVCRDVTGRKKAAEKLMNVNKQLESFAHTVSHDLRSPLTGVTCYTELIKEKYGDVLKGDGLFMLKEVETQAARMLSIIEDMLCFSTAEHIEPTKTPVNTNEIVKQVLLDNRFEIDGKKVLVSAGELPKLKIPETLLYELISNVLLNAVRYGCKEGGLIEILGETKSRHNALIILDHGPGIPEQERKSVFEVFVRGSTSRDTVGTGIGLATVNKITDRFKGEVQLEETPGGGCTVKLLFPAD
jgi:PAS domain S-box-containing protein